LPIQDSRSSASQGLPCEPLACSLSTAASSWGRARGDAAKATSGCAVAADHYRPGRGPQAAHGLVRGCRKVRALT
jgi:hypothetical protein